MLKSLDVINIDGTITDEELNIAFNDPSIGDLDGNANNISVEELAILNTIKQLNGDKNLISSIMKGDYSNISESTMDRLQELSDAIKEIRSSESTPDPTPKSEIGSKEWAAQFTQYDLKWYDIKYDEQGRVSELKWNGTDGKVTVKTVGPNILFKYYDDGSYDVAQSGGLQLQDHSILTKYSADGTKLAEVTIPNPPKEPKITSLPDNFVEEQLGVNLDNAQDVQYDSYGRVTSFKTVNKMLDRIRGLYKNRAYIKEYSITYNNDGTFNVTERITYKSTQKIADSATMDYSIANMTYSADGELLDSKKVTVMKDGTEIEE